MPPTFFKFYPNLNLLFGSRSSPAPGTLVGTAVELVVDDVVDEEDAVDEFTRLLRTESLPLVSPFRITSLIMSVG